MANKRSDLTRLRERTKHLERQLLSARIGQIDPKQRYTIDETILLMRSSRATVYGKVKRGELKLLKDGGRSYVPGSEIIRCSTLQDQAT